MSDFNVHNLNEYLESHIPQNEYKEVKRLLYGTSDVQVLELPTIATSLAAAKKFEIKAYSIPAYDEQTRKPRKVRVGAIQNSIAIDTNTSIGTQRDAILKKVVEVIKAAGEANVNILCLQEAWSMPYAYCTREKFPKCEFSEDAETGQTTRILQVLAEAYNMVIISPILERDTSHGYAIWNTAVVISNKGHLIGKHRKNHIPRVADFSEPTYYKQGDTGHPVFETDFGKIAVNMCYGRHHPQNWMMFGLNGAEIVFNPCATGGPSSEPLWGIEARNAAVANSYYTVAINRVGSEKSPHEYTTNDGKKARKVFGPFYGSSYVSAPNGIRTPGLSRDRDGLLITDVDLNLCRQVKDLWSFPMTQRLPLYAESFQRASQVDFKPQIIRE